MQEKVEVTICGRLGADLEIRKTVSSTPYGILRVAVNRKETRSSVDKPVIITKWYKVLIWNQYLLNYIAPQLKKGEKVLLKGTLDPIIATDSESSNTLIISLRGKNAEIAVLNSPPLNIDKSEPEQLEEEFHIEELTSFQN